MEIVFFKIKCCFYIRNNIDFLVFIVRNCSFYYGNFFDLEVEGLFWFRFGILLKYEVFIKKDKMKVRGFCG